jgi:peroxiredoxin
MNKFRTETLLALALCLATLSTPTQAQFQPLPLQTPEPLQASEPLQPGTRAPAFTTRTVDGKTLKLSSLRGHVVLIDYWATWCGPCQMATPVYQSLYQKYRNRGLRVIGMSVDDERTVKYIKPFMRHFGMTYTVTADPAKNIAAKEAYGSRGIPTQYLIDKKGIVRWSQDGFSFDEQQSLPPLIEKLLKEKS